MRRAWCAAAVIAAMLGAATDAAAGTAAHQETRNAVAAPDTATPTTDAQRRRVARLARLHAEASDAARAALAEERGEDESRETVQVGALVLHVDSTRAVLAAAAAGRAWPVIESMYGRASARLATAPMRLRLPGDSAATPSGADSLAVLTTGDGQRTTMRWTERALSRRLLVMAAGSMRSAMDPALRDWIGTYGVSALDDAIFRRAWEELATSRSTVARACLLGEIARCREALVLVDARDPVTAWYDAARRRELATERRWRLRPRAPVAWDACVAGNDDRCLEVLRALPADEVPAPLGTASRHAFVRLALERGGADAFERLLTSRHPTIEARLAHAAGTPSDSLLAEWHRRVRESESRRAGLAASSAVSTLLWIAFFGLLATRSSRWR